MRYEPSCPDLGREASWPGQRIGSVEMANFFTADTHFEHGGALGLFRRPFASVAEMNEALIARWNEAVGAVDEGWHPLGTSVEGGSPAMPGERPVRA